MAILRLSQIRPELPGRELMLSLAQRYAEGRKGPDLEIVGYGVDSILQMLVSKLIRRPKRNLKITPLPSLRENFSVLTSRAGFMAGTPFSVSQENSIRMAAMCCLTVGGGAWRCKVSI